MMLKPSFDVQRLDSNSHNFQLKISRALSTTPRQVEIEQLMRFYLENGKLLNDAWDGTQEDFRLDLNIAGSSTYTVEEVMSDLAYSSHLGQALTGRLAVPKLRRLQSNCR